MPRVSSQPVLPLDGLKTENPSFLREQLVTYIGNKRALLEPIRGAVQEVCERYDRPLRVLDAFSGSGVVSRMLKPRSTAEIFVGQSV